jgi:signal transduction histidine kinase/DNA-binding response OmpR family regulator
MSKVIAVLAPVGRDASVISDILSRAGIDNEVASGSRSTFETLEPGEIGAIIATEEAFGQDELAAAEAFLRRQPTWSDLPVLLLTKRTGGSLYQPNLAAALGNVTILERPLSPVMLVSAAQAALRARARQRQAERHILELAARERELTEERARLKASEARLREANEKLGRRFAEALAERRLLADLVDGTDAFVQVADLNYRWLAINRASADEFERIYGVRPQVGKSMLDVLDHVPEQRRAVQAVWGRALAGEEFTETGEFGDPGRDKRSYEMRYNTLRNERGERIGAYQFVYDVTDRVREQEQLTATQAQMHELAKLETLGQLTGGVAHDFNNLLTPIVGALDILHRKRVGDDRSARLVAGALESAHRATVLVQRLLTFARRQHLETRSIDVGALIEGIRDLVQSSIGSHVSVGVSVAPSLPAVKTDPNQLELAVLNLAVNASDAMPGGGSLAIDVSGRRLGNGELNGLPPGDYIRLAVTDTGTGMDEETISRSIEPFFTTKGVGKGTGLGLSMVHGLAAQSGGALKLRSRIGQGTTAEIYLPVSDQAADTLPAHEEQSLRPARRLLILLVDDEDVVRRATAGMLTEIGHDVLEAASPISALDLLRDRSDIDLVVTDYLMPGMRGTELIRVARELRPELPALLITGYARLASGSDQAVARLPKPFRVLDLSREIESLLSGNTVVDLAERRTRSGRILG